METNANSNVLSALLADARVGTFTGIVTTKQGKEVGKGADRKTYGDDTVHTVIFTGFRYDNLVKRSLDALNAMSEQEILDAATAKGLAVTADDVAAARAELLGSFQKSFAGENESTTDHVYDPLVVDGETVRGGRVYVCHKDKINPTTGECYACGCRDCTGDEKAPKHGTIYIQGLRVFNKVLTPAVNGPIPEPKSAPKTVAKNFMRGMLPVSKYVSYRLEPGQDFLLRVGGTAAVEAVNGGFVANDDVIELLNKAA